MDRLVSIRQASDAVGISVQRLRRLANTGRVPVQLTQGGHRRFDLDALRAALAPQWEPSNLVSSLGNPDWDGAYSLAGLQEVDVWRDAWKALGLVRGSEAYGMFHYAFTEMLNNAIDHSGGSRVEARAWMDPVAFEIQDDGVGAYRRLSTALNLASDMGAIIELSKGKATSNPDHHSGQGVFFTSKALDVFRLESNGISWVVDNAIGDQAVGVSAVTVGTRVSGTFAREPARTLIEIFAAFTDDDYEFSRTRPSVKLVEMGSSFVSRSEAKLILTRLEQFAEVELDFSGVSSVGQGFVDEVFRVWPAVHPGTRIEPINMNPAIEFMVRRGLAELRPVDEPRLP